MRDLLDEIGRRFGAGGFVGGEFLFAEGGAEALVDGDYILRLIGCEQAAEHVVENVDGFGGGAAGGAHGWGRRAGTSVIGAKDKAEGIDEKEAGFGEVEVGHGGNLIIPGFTSLRCGVFDTAFALGCVVILTRKFAYKVLQINGLQFSIELLQ